MSNQIARNGNSTYVEVKRFQEEYDLDTNQTIPDITETKVLWDIPPSSNLLGYLDYAGTGDFTAVEKGIYDIDVTVVWSVVGAGASGQRRIYIEYGNNGTELGAQSHDAIPGTTQTTAMSTSRRLILLPGDTFCVKVFANQGSAVDLNGLATSTARFCRCTITYNNGTVN